jgi:alpha-L-fucosidase
LYYSTFNNFFKHVENGKVINGSSNDQKKYNDICVHQLTELWTKYGEIYEIWFDGGLLPPDKGGVDIFPIIKKHQPHAVVFGGCQYNYNQCIRWAGNENGQAVYPNWSTADNVSTECISGGSMHAQHWCPAECDSPLRGNGAHEWFWAPDGVLYVKTLDQLLSEYYSSVGRNGNYLLNINPNQHGLIDHVDMQRYVEFGTALQTLSIDNAIGFTNGTQDPLTIVLDSAAYVDTIITMEDLNYGETVRLYVLEAQVAGDWSVVSEGYSIGHKKIDQIKPVLATAIRFRALETDGAAHIRLFAAYFVGPY